MNQKSAILIIALIILVTLFAVSQALHIYEEGNITLEEHDHDHTEHDHAEHEENEEHTNESDKNNNTHHETEKNNT